MASTSTSSSRGLAHQTIDAAYLKLNALAQAYRADSKKSDKIGAVLAMMDKAAVLEGQLWVAASVLEGEDMEGVEMLVSAWEGAFATSTFFHSSLECGQRDNFQCVVTGYGYDRLAQKTLGEAEYTNWLDDLLDVKGKRMTKCEVVHLIPFSTGKIADSPVRRVLSFSVRLRHSSDKCNKALSVLAMLDHAATPKGQEWVARKVLDGEGMTGVDELVLAWKGSAAGVTSCIVSGKGYSELAKKAMSPKDFSNWRENLLEVQKRENVYQLDMDPEIAVDYFEHRADLDHTTRISFKDKPSPPSPKILRLLEMIYDMSHASAAAKAVLLKAIEDPESVGSMSGEEGSNEPLTLAKMVKATKGTLVTCDPAVKQILLQLEETGKEQFIIQELDDTHLLVKADSMDRVGRELELELEKNNYVHMET
ncbi:TFIIH basal transcription factor complex TTD-A subunit [Pseudohyphozyma bogoriensis]|nr:TFIIH basal transcription factor complex TTD-A subunit [Pseudohyphozyma bogoriensis]